MWPISVEGLYGELQALRAELAALRVQIRGLIDAAVLPPAPAGCGRVHTTVRGRCEMCGEVAPSTARDATDLIALCSACFDLFKTAGLIPFMPAGRVCDHRNYVHESIERLAGRRLGNRWKGRAA